MIACRGFADTSRGGKGIYMGELQEVLKDNFRDFIRVYEVDYIVNGYARKMYFLGRHSAYEFRDALRLAIPPKTIFIKAREFDDALASFLCKDFING